MTLLRTSPADATAAPPDAEALFKEARRRRRRRRLGWALGVVGVVAVLVATAWLASSPPAGRTAPAQTRIRPPAAGTASFPTTIVGWTASQDLVVVSTKTGQVERTLASDVSIFAPGLPSVSVAPDGTVYFESATASTVPAESATGDQILSVSISGGPVHDLGAGSDPQVSPDGQEVAYIAADPQGAAGEAPYLVPPVGIVVASVSPTGTLETMRTLEPGPAQVNQGASDLSWSSDSAALSFDLYDPTNQTSSTWVVPTGPGVASLAEATRVPVDGAGLSWTGFFGKSRSGRDQGIGVASGSGDRQTIVTIDQHTGKVTSRLFTMPAAVCASVTPTPNGCTSLFSNPVIGDSEGTSVLVAGAIPFFYGSPTTSGASSLYVWHQGSAKPVRLSGHIDVASWGPRRGGS